MEDALQLIHGNDRLVSGILACALGQRILSGSGYESPGGGIDPSAPMSLATAGELEHAVLHLLASRGAVGSGTLTERLQALGYTGSEPTVGRFLRALDRRGLTTRVSNRGRDLTEAGRQQLQQLCELASRQHYERELIETIRIGSIDDIIEVLVARRALERETARLAAEHATAEEILALEEAIRSQREALATTGVAVGADELFHRLVAQAGRNRILVAAIDLIRRDKQMMMWIDTILRRTAHPWVIGHDQILDAIRRHDADAAERAMLAHLNLLTDEVRQYQRALATGADEAARASRPTVRPKVGNRRAPSILGTESPA